MLLIYLILCVWTFDYEGESFEFDRIKNKMHMLNENAMLSSKNEVSNQGINKETTLTMVIDFLGIQKIHNLYS